MKKIVVIFSTLIIIITCCTGCIRWFVPSQPEDTYPVYNKEVNEVDGIAVYVDGVKYKAKPEQEWQGQKDSEVILGYAGGKNKLYLVQDDVPMNFLLIWDSALCPYGSSHEIVLYREGLPEPSGETVDEIYWSEYDFTDTANAQHYSFSFKEKEKIKKLFDIWESGEKTWDTGDQTNYAVDMFCSSSQVPGAYFELQLDISNDKKMMMGNWYQGYTEVPIDLLEEISGHVINFDAWNNQ